MQNEVQNIQTANTEKAYWEQLYNKDQTYRHEKADDIIDNKNLLQVVALYNERGYPKKAFGFKALTAPWIIWTHNMSFEAKREAFPLILRGHQLNRIPPGLFPDYFLEGLFLAKYGREYQGAYTLENLKDQLNLNTSDKIDIEKVKKGLEESFRFRKKQVLHYIGKWQKTGQDKDTTQVSIQVRADQKIYYVEEYLDGSYNPQEIKPRTNYQHTFDFKESLYKNYLRINKNGHLHLYNTHDSLLRAYPKLARE